MELRLRFGRFRLERELNTVRYESKDFRDNLVYKKQNLKGHGVEECRQSPELVIFISYYR